MIYRIRFSVLFSVLTMGVLSPIAQGQPPVVRYTFDEVGGAAIDSGSGPMSSGVLGPDTTRTDNTPGGFSPFALDLSAPGPESNLFVGPTPEVDGLEEFTMTTWLYLEGLNADQGGSGNVRLLAAQAGNANFDGFSWNLNNPNEGDRGIDNFKLGMFIGGENAFAFGQSSQDLSAENQWTFMAVTYNGSESLDNMSFYFGDEVNPTEQLGDPQSVDAGRVNSTIGLANFGIGFTDAADGIDFAADGFQDDVRVYDRVLDVGELEVVRLENLVSFTTCDFTGEGVCDIEDLDELLNNLGGPNPTYDLDSTDPNINLGDRDAWLSLAGDQNVGRAYSTGDSDLDGDVDAGDLNNLGVAWLTSNNPGWGNGDFNGDDLVNAGDLNDLGINWQQGVAAPLASAVPRTGDFSALDVMDVVDFSSLAKTIIVASRESSPASPVTPPPILPPPPHLPPPMHIPSHSPLLAAIVLAHLVSSPSSAAVDFKSQIQPILESTCLHCHGEEDPEGGLRIDSRPATLAGGDSGPAIVAGKPDQSPLYTTTILPADNDEIMPPDGPPLAKFQSDLLRDWIAAGAYWPDDAQLTVQPRIDFVNHIQPILEENCLSCHAGEDSESDYDLSTREAAFGDGAEDAFVVRFEPMKSALYMLTVLGKDDDELMPPANAGGPLPKELSERLSEWIAQGAIWPAGLTLKAKVKVVDRADSPDNLELVKRIHALIVETSREKSVAEMADYAAKVPRTAADYHMVALEGGTFLMGSPPGEEHREENEGPQTKVSVAPLWIGKYEVTWDEYEPFMITQVDREKHGARRDYDPTVHTIVDAVSQPTNPYMEMSFGMGQEGFPAISMTQHAANKYCQWLSAQTGHFYRLPTEAEWEYACRAGTTSAYSFGDDSAQIGDYAWYYENSNEKYQKVGKKKANPWGLHDMHGNVMEWTADRFSLDYFLEIAGSNSYPFLKPGRLYPRTVRGGGWDDDAENLRSAFRKGSDSVWKQQDPQLPKSIWYHTDAQWLGFRVVRPLEIPSVEEMYFYWNSATGAKK